MAMRHTDPADANGSMALPPTPSVEPFDPDRLQRLNNAPVSPADIRRYIKTCGAKRRSDDPDYNLAMQLMTAAERVNQDRLRTLALFYRARALSLIATADEGLPRWAFEGADALFAAAAVEHLSSNAEGDLVFDRGTFLNRVFQFVEPEVWLQ